MTFSSWDDDTDLAVAQAISQATDRYPAEIRPPAFPAEPALTARDWSMLGILAAGAADEAQRAGNARAAKQYADLARKCDTGAEASRRRRARGTVAP